MDVTLADEDTNSIPTDDEVKWTILRVLGNWAPRLSPGKLGPSFSGAQFAVSLGPNINVYSRKCTSPNC